MSAFFYLRVVAAMYFNEPLRQWQARSTPLLGVGLGMMALATVGFGLFSNSVLDIAQKWVQAFS